MTKEPDGKLIQSLNEGIAKELKLIELEQRAELSPIGILDVLVTHVDLIDPGLQYDCKSQGNCENKNTCVVKDCTGYCGVYNEPDGCMRNECNSDYCGPHDPDAQDCVPNPES
jgi:hypothetical protein